MDSSKRDGQGGEIVGSQGLAGKGKVRQARHEAGVKDEPGASRYDL